VDDKDDQDSDNDKDETDKDGSNSKDEEKGNSGKIDPDNFDKLPKTGGMPIFDLLAIGVLLVVAGALLMRKKSKKV
jgi:LPXTG-motif cell wall-anchored protein